MTWFLAWLLLAAAQTVRAQSGDWVGEVNFGGPRWHLALHLDPPSGGALRGTADCIEQNAFDLPVSGAARSGRIEIRVASIGGSFSGAVSGDRLEGVWRQAGVSLSLSFRRGNLRPQEPRPPFPYREEEVLLRNAGVRLAGTLSLPATTPPHPAVLLLAGSGPQDRNGTASGHRPWLVLAACLARRGVAVLRMDDRGVGGSNGSLLDSTDEDFAGDALAAVGFLGSRPEIDPRRIGLVGHSEGGIVASIAAARSAEVSFVVLLSAPALPGDRILEAQAAAVARAAGIPDHVARANLEVERALVGIAREDLDPAVAARRMDEAVRRAARRLPPEAAALVEAEAAGQVRLASSRWFRFLLDYDPLPDLVRLEVPVLAIYGALDLQVQPDLNQPLMESALRHGTVVRLPRLNHLLQTARTGSPLEYPEIEETMAPAVLERIAEWIAARRPAATPAR